MTSTYSRDNLAALPADDDDLTTAFASPADYNAVASNDGTTVDQSGTEGYALFEWKETATGNSGTFTWKGESTKAPSESKVQMQIYKRTGTGAPVWEDVTDAFDDSTAADTNFTISGTVSPLGDYKAGVTNEVALRTWQAASGGTPYSKTFGNNTTNDYSGVHDTYLELASPTTNYGSNDDIFIDRYDASYHRNSLIRFTGLSNIPSNATITSVVLTLYNYQSNGAPTLDLHKVLRDWVLAEATWNIYSTGNSWGTGGCENFGTDCTAGASASTTATPSSYIQWGSTSQMVADVQSWVNGSATNNGWLVVRQDAGEDNAFTHCYSSDRQFADGYLPYLTVEYTA